MKFLADMGVSQTTVRWLKQQGYDAIHLRDERLQRLPDDQIIEKARKEGRIILTFDLDFGELMAKSHGLCPSVIIFRLSNATPQNVNRHLTQVLKDSTDELINGAVISVGDKKHRIRLLPIKF